MEVTRTNTLIVKTSAVSTAECVEVKQVVRRVGVVKTEGSGIEAGEVEDSVVQHC